MTPYLEIGGDYREILPGVYLLELPLPSSLGLINVYLVRLAEGYLLLDCGMATGACFQALARAREGIGIEWGEIREVVLTHIHPDHMGLASKVLALTGARLTLHAAEHRLLEQILARDRHREWHQETLARAGVPAEMIERIISSLLEVQKSFQPLEPDTVFEGGERLTTATGELEVIWTPGHSPGHICLYNRGLRLLFAGDHMLEHITPNIGWQPGRDALGEYLDSLDRVAELEIDLILPSHGSPFRGHRQWIRQTHEHHAQRCGRILEAVVLGPRTASELVGKVWDRELSPFHYRFAVFEVLAHLEYLERRGRLRAESRNGIQLWRS